MLPTSLKGEGSGTCAKCGKIGPLCMCFVRPKFKVNVPVVAGLAIMLSPLVYFLLKK